MELEDEHLQLYSRVAVEKIFSTYLATIYVFHGSFTKQKINKAVGLERSNKLGLVQPHAVVLLRPYGVVLTYASRNQIIRSWKIRGSPEIIVAIVRHQSSHISVGVIGALRYPVHPFPDPWYVVLVPPGALRWERVRATGKYLPAIR